MASVGSAKRSCGTCRDRRIACDRAKPNCSQCAKSKRKCKGYDLQLFWPRASDGRRAIVAKHPLPRKGIHRSDTFVVNVRSWDVEMHYRLNGSLPDGPWPVLWIPMPFNPMLVDVENDDLFQYFQNVASQALTIFGHEPTDLGKLLIRLALVGNSSSSKAVLHSLLSLSSLHRYGVQEQAMRLKISSLKALAATPKDNMGPVELCQHIAAGMLLCSFEVHQSSCTSSQWTFYISGVKEIMDVSCRAGFRHHSDVTPLINWVYYHDVLTRFTMRHWRGDTASRPVDPSVNILDLECARRTLIPPAKISFKQRCCPVSMPDHMVVMDQLSQICDVLSTPPDESMSKEELEDYTSRLRVLDWRVRNLPVCPKAIDSVLPTGFEMCETATITELYQLAILVYLNRASRNILDQASRTQQHVDRAFALFSQLRACERQFPLFIIGCEARSDEQRIIALDLIARTEKRDSSRSIIQVKLLLQAVWAQADLADGELDYWDKLTSIISCCAIIPSLV